MNSYPDAQQVVDSVGEKFLNAFVAAVEGARDDLATFQDEHPEWFIDFSKRFVANFIHERMWARTQREVHDHPDVRVIDQEPVRQMIVRDRYVIRFKRHKPTLSISTYPTGQALAFWSNRIMIPGTETHSLALGYIWDPDEARIGETIMSYRTDKNTPVWSVTLTDSVDESTGATEIGWKPIEPGLPEIDLSDILDEDDDSEGSSDAG